ncbi:hypothetical protein ZWY2020_020579 [Hordeum vulgare]|nr:hypothetical protein ZWY2020_020579 [Hordeum vulgare]
MGHLHDAAGSLCLPPAMPQRSPEAEPQAAPLPPPPQKAAAVVAASMPWTLRSESVVLSLRQHGRRIARDAVVDDSGGYGAARRHARSVRRSAGRGGDRGGRVRPDWRPAAAAPEAGAVVQRQLDVRRRFPILPLTPPNYLIRAKKPPVLSLPSIYTLLVSEQYNNSSTDDPANGNTTATNCLVQSLFPGYG